MNFKFELGDEVSDMVTGLVGVIVARSEYLNGCKQYCLKVQKLKDGKPIEGEWIDQQQLKLIKSDKLGIIKNNTGGPVSGFRMPKL